MEKKKIAKRIVLSLLVFVHLLLATAATSALLASVGNCSFPFRLTVALETTHPDSELYGYLFFIL